MSPASIVVIGGSAGALDPLREIASNLPPDFQAPVLVAVHVSPDHPSHLPDLLSGSGPLPAQHAQDGERLLPGRIYVAPPDHHLLVGRKSFDCRAGPKENRSRPSIDVLFRSAAYTHRAGVIGMVLSGMLDDGTSGLWTIKQAGGHAIVQRPEDAEYESMPLSALRAVHVDTLCPAADIVPTLQRLLREPGTRGRRESMNDDQWRQLKLEVDVASEDNAFRVRPADPGLTVRVHLPGVPRRADPPPGGERAALPLSHRACLHRREPPERTAGLSRGEPVECDAHHRRGSDAARPLHQAL